MVVCCGTVNDDHVKSILSQISLSFSRQYAGYSVEPDLIAFVGRCPNEPVTVVVVSLASE